MARHWSSPRLGPCHHRCNVRAGETEKSLYLLISNAWKPNSKPGQASAASSLAKCRNAETAGADRIELCTELAVGGITPSYGTIQKVKEDLKIAVNVLIRPRSGDFSYSESQYDIIKRDISFCKENEDHVLLHAFRMVFCSLSENVTVFLKEDKSDQSVEACFQLVFVDEENLTKPILVIGLERDQVEQSEFYISKITTKKKVIEDWKNYSNKIGFQFHTPFMKGDPLWLPFGEKRTKVIDDIISLKKNSYKDYIINPTEQLEVMKKSWGGKGTTPVDCPTWAILSVDHLGRESIQFAAKVSGSAEIFRRGLQTTRNGVMILRIKLRIKNMNELTGKHMGDQTWLRDTR